jgi:hypothetical protein
MANGLPADPTFVVRFEDVARDVEIEPLLREAQDEVARAESRLALARAVDSRRRELEEWLAADPANPELLLTDPAEGLRLALPGVEIPEHAPGAGELLAQLVELHPVRRAGVVVFTPPEVFAVQLLRDVAEDAAQRPTGYDELFADIGGTVARVEAGRFGADVVARVVAAVSFVRGLPVPVAPAPPRPARSALAALLDDRPDIRRRLLP